jgi:uncharacterized protein YoxC
MRKFIKFFGVFVSKRQGASYTMVWAAMGIRPDGEVKSMVLEISAAVIAAAFVVLTVYAVITIRAAKLTLAHAAKIMVRLEKQADDIGREAKRLLQSTNRLTEDVEHKIKTVDGFFQSASQAGEAIHEAASSVKQISSSVSRSVTANVEQAVHRNQERMTALLEWATLTLSLVESFKSMRKQTLNKGEDCNVG